MSKKKPTPTQSMQVEYSDLANQVGAFFAWALVWLCYCALGNDPVLPKETYEVKTQLAKDG